MALPAQRKKEAVIENPIKGFIIGGKKYKAIEFYEGKVKAELIMVCCVLPWPGIQLGDPVQTVILQWPLEVNNIKILYN